ncbi:MAG TPA: FBP domain-containing protein [Bdellovibrionales bacterium]|nr:FBP domain-containing protein [Bdellovibrionales bacterium]
MFKITSEAEFRDVFRPIDRKELQLPTDLRFPMLVRGTMAWVEPGGHRTFLVFEDPNKKALRGVVFKRSSGASDVATMCDFCHSVRGTSSVGMLTATIDKKRRVGVVACSDLSCQAKLDEKIPSVNDLRESLRPDQKRNFLLERINGFADNHLEWPIAIQFQS